jgi:hypothetical protein
MEISQDLTTGDNRRDASTPSIAMLRRGPAGHIQPTALTPVSAVRRYLDCSTMHLDAPEGMGLDALGDTCEPVTAYPYDEGAFVWVPRADDFEGRDWTGWGNLRRVLEHARRLDCDWVRFDIGGLELPGFPRFNW